jgi:hypothetical protein
MLCGGVRPRPLLLALLPQHLGLLSARLRAPVALGHSSIVLHDGAVFVPGNEDGAIMEDY